MRPSIERLEVFLDGERAPLRILLRPPFKFQLDTRLLPPGSHVLRIESVLSDGRREQRRVRFDADKVPLIVFEGLGAEGPGQARLGGRRPWALAIVLALGIAGAAAGWRAREPAPAAAPSPSAGRVVFERACARCHGAQPDEPLRRAAARVDAARFEPWAREHLRERGTPSLSAEELRSLFELLQRRPDAPGFGAD